MQTKEKRARNFVPARDFCVRVGTLFALRCGGLLHEGAEPDESSADVAGFDEYAEGKADCDGRAP